jgi:hypothetical protein
VFISMIHWIYAVVSITNMYFAISISRWKSHYMVVIAMPMLFWLLALWILLLNQVWRYVTILLLGFCVQYRVSCFLSFLTAVRKGLYQNQANIVDFHYKLFACCSRDVWFASNIELPAFWMFCSLLSGLMFYAHQI